MAADIQKEDLSITISEENRARTQLSRQQSDYQQHNLYIQIQCMDNHSGDE